MLQVMVISKKKKKRERESKKENNKKGKTQSKEMLYKNVALHQANVYQLGKQRSICPFQTVSIQYSAFLHAHTTK